jgi:hypothetical protein
MIGCAVSHPVGLCRCIAIKSPLHDHKLVSKAPKVGPGKTEQSISIRPPFEFVLFWFILESHHTPILPVHRSL